ncbi:MAG: quinone-dependent dihydroorotate dehydrogenase [Rhodobacteraceae bacterium]|nr:quinone-dependent dihydroorotate dehydrogenase [Paracoccaceae bacterium]
MSVLERLAMPVLHRLDPEQAHDLSLLALRTGLGPRTGPVRGMRLATRVAGLDLPNPLGLAAGYDKNAVAIGPLLRAGFGFVEAGAVTPRAQEGNPRPRLFRLPVDGAVINRFGFNNEGAEVVAERLGRPRPEGVLGLNLGANRDSPDRAADYAELVARCGALVDFVTVNVSSPNTERLRDLEGRAALSALLRGVMERREELPRKPALFLKLSPDIALPDLGEIAELAMELQLDGIIATNSTVARDGLTDRQAIQAGGMSGTPLFERSTRVLAQLAYVTEGAIPLIGVGGVRCGETAYAKIRAGASAVQLYTGLVYGGLTLVPRILSELDTLLARDGFASVAEAVGTGRQDWL